MTDGLLKRAFASVARSLREFGYPSVTADEIARHHETWKRGGMRLTNVIFMFAADEFKKHPDIFGKPGDGDQTP